jgi:pyruvate/2-oxoglutarate dehydrogenase complex dihydrolipoamide dehydrogenase (E3) component
MAKNTDYKRFVQMDLAALAEEMRAGVEICDRRYLLKTHKECFVGSDACRWLVEQGHAQNLVDAQVLGNLMREAGLLHHVVRDHEFKNDYLFYRFSVDEDHGHVPQNLTHSARSWLNLLGQDKRERFRINLLPEIPGSSEEFGTCGPVSEFELAPKDEYNAKLLDNVFPRAWKNPEPAPCYNLVVIGAGAGGLVSAVGAAGVGARVALVEESFLGGDCLNFGCVPSKALLSAAKVANVVRNAGEYGVEVQGDVHVDFGKVMERMRRIRSDISSHDSAARFTAMGIDVYRGRARFLGPRMIEVAGSTLHFKRCVIATGGRPAVPAIEGMSQVPFLTNMSLFNLTSRPRRLAIIGAGAIGVEMAQAFQRLGSDVSLFSRGERILPREEVEAARLVQESLEHDGVIIHFGSRYSKVSALPGDSEFSHILLELEGGRRYEFDAILVASGRQPSVEGLNLSEAGVEYDVATGIRVNDRLQSSNPNIYAVGDVATKYKFTHVADSMARIVIRNALFWGRSKFSELIIPWCTYSDPELAHVGLYENDLIRRHIPYDTFTRRFSEVDRRRTDGKATGYVRVHVKQGSDVILGATIVGEGAGELINEITTAMYANLGLGQLAQVIHPYPTAAEAIRQLGDQYNKTRATPLVRSLLRGLMRLQR